MLELLINCWVFTPKGCCWGTFGHTAQLVLEGSGGCGSSSSKEQQSPARALAPTNTHQRASRALSPTTAPAKSCCFGGQVLAGSCAKLSANIWEGEKLVRTARGERAGAGCWLGAKHPANFPLPIHQLATCSE